MKEPKPIKIRGPGNIQIRVTGYSNEKYLPHLAVTSGDENIYGFIEAKDVKRLNKWCEDCLRKRNDSRTNAIGVWGVNEKAN